MKGCYLDYLGIAAIITALATFISSIRNGRTGRKIKDNVNSRMEEMIHQLKIKDVEIRRLKKALGYRYRKGEVDD